MCEYFSRPNMTLTRTLIKKTAQGGKKLIRWMQTERLLATKKRCPVCNNRMKFKRTNTTKDGYRWCCRRRTHKDRAILRSIREGSVFSRSHIPLPSWMKLMHSLSQGLRKRQVDMIEDGVCGSSKSLTRVTTLLREICGEAVRRLERRRKMRIGGRRAFVAIDESKFRHKQKYGRGRHGPTWRRRSWVFGMLEVKRSRRHPVLKLVENRSRMQLLTIIRKYIRPGSEVISDSWRAYNRLSREGYIHYQVNHQRHFVHPGSGAHTQHIERGWQSFKEGIYRYRGNLTERALKMNLRFIEWNHWLGKEHRKGILGRLLKDIRACYKV
ncbi:uncharacterized protein LOC127358739 [Dicentrarchus labrax]|uniref:uncharacterized protein LOC127358739 n=1 Tax=Dicentrarchus labrax TaxID=13489 RepID=UPI0021F599AA|nr:uncharacterized protein LOC127358739 [Dicentrarchus labrax]